MLSWLVFFGIVAALVGVSIWLALSTKKWKTPPIGRGAEAQQAEARLWATKIGDQGGGGGT